MWAGSFREFTAIQGTHMAREDRAPLSATKRKDRPGLLPCPEMQLELCEIGDIHIAINIEIGRVATE